MGRQLRSYHWRQSLRSPCSLGILKPTINPPTHRRYQLKLKPCSPNIATDATNRDIVTSPRTAAPASAADLSIASASKPCTPTADAHFPVTYARYKCLCWFPGGAILFVDADSFLNMGDNLVLYASSFYAAASLAVLVFGWQRGGGWPPHPLGPREYPPLGSVLEILRGVPVWKGFSAIAQNTVSIRFPLANTPDSRYCCSDTDA